MWGRGATIGLGRRQRTSKLLFLLSDLGKIISPSVPLVLHLQKKAANSPLSAPDEIITVQAPYGLHGTSQVIEPTLWAVSFAKRLPGC